MELSVRYVLIEAGRSERIHVMEMPRVKITRSLFLEQKKRMPKGMRTVEHYSCFFYSELVTVAFGTTHHVGLREDSVVATRTKAG
jgi:GTP1/Obg family GTP-binding protein